MELIKILENSATNLEKFNCNISHFFKGLYNCPVETMKELYKDINKYFKK